jgi:hypothetical protein
VGNVKILIAYKHIAKLTKGAMKYLLFVFWHPFASTKTAEHKASAVFGNI